MSGLTFSVGLPEEVLIGLRRRVDVIGSVGSHTKLDDTLTADLNRKLATLVVWIDEKDPCIPKIIRRGFIGPLLGVLEPLDGPRQTQRREAIELTFLKAGGDRLVSWPCSLAKIEQSAAALQRRPIHAPKPTVEMLCFGAGRYTIDTVRRVFCDRGKPVHLTATEFNVLAMMARRPEVVFSRGVLAECAEWGRCGAADVNSHMKRIRKSVGDRHIITPVYGIGYKVSP